jgi:acyl-CoA reductase-like NAD-dependent aldehyde dehydrogenase
MASGDSRLSVLKTYKLYIGGKFPRTESGRYLVASNARSGEHLANYCQASRKDFRDAVRAAGAARKSWAGATPYLRGQILYRAAEMLEGRADALATELQDSAGLTTAQAKREVSSTIDRLIYFAGWTDKYTSIFGSVNPVASSHFNFTVPEPTGIVGIICPDSPPLLPLVTMLATAVLSGNTTVILASEEYPLPAITFAEILATSDLPGGVVNILSGVREELVPHFASHMEVNAVVDGSGDPTIKSKLQAGVAENLKRVSTVPLLEKEWFSDATETPYRISDTIEFKTAWHPIGV